METVNLEVGCSYLLKGKDRYSGPWLTEYKVERITGTAICLLEICRTENNPFHRWILIEEFDSEFVIIEKL